MDPLSSLSATPKAWLLNSVLAPHAGTFVAHLKQGRYSPTTRRTYLGSLANLARWISQCRLPLRLLDESAVERFLVRHVPHCDCPRPVNRTHSDLRAACTHLLDVLREQHVIAERPGEVGPVADELCRYDAHMQRVQGLIEGTRDARLRIVRRLLLYKFADGPVVIGELQPDDVRKFIAQQLDLRSTTSNATTVTSALRAYLRYRTSCGDRVHGLVSAIAKPAHWSLAALPRALTATPRPAACSARLSPLYPRHDAVMPWRVVRWIWGCAAARWPSCSFPTSIGAVAP